MTNEALQAVADKALEIHKLAVDGFNSAARRGQENIKVKLKMADEHLSTAQGEFGLIAEDGRDPLEQAQRMSAKIKDARDIIGQFLDDGVVGDTDVKGDMNQ